MARMNAYWLYTDYTFHIVGATSFRKATQALNAAGIPVTWKGLQINGGISKEGQDRQAVRAHGPGVVLRRRRNSMSGGFSYDPVR